MEDDVPPGPGEPAADRARGAAADRLNEEPKPVHHPEKAPAPAAAPRDKALSFAERIYLPEILKGLRITLRHFFANIYLWGQRQVVTYQYPEQKRPVSPRWRGRHRLTVRDDGSPRCTACFLCS